VTDERRFDGRVAAITGGGGGMGRAFALDLAARGARVAVCGRRPEPIAETVSLVEAAGGEALAVQCDVRDPAQVDAFFDAAGERFGAPDLLVNNAAGNFICPAIDLSPNGWNAVVGIVLNGTFLCSRAFALRYRDAGHARGAIVSVVATYAWTGNPGTVHSAAAKAGVLNLMKTLAVEWAPLGIRANSIAPGPIETPGATQNLFPTEEIRAAITAGIPAGRFGTLDDVVAAARFLLSDEAGYVTGACLTLDGGESLGQGMFAFGGNAAGAGG
jgi:NAD(P)-dependent dehydrogenase (short-subunit alcohol dehydrogenase family)